MTGFIGLFDTARDNILHTSVHCHVFIFRCLVAGSNGGRSPSSGFPKCSRPLLPASHSNRSQQLSLRSSLTMEGFRVDVEAGCKQPEVTI
jgi:hypothetical protein